MPKCEHKNKKKDVEHGGVECPDCGSWWPGGEVGAMFSIPAKAAKKAAPRKEVK